MPRVGLLWRREWDPPTPGDLVPETSRLRGVFAAFADLDVEAQPVIYTDERVAEVRSELLALDGVLVWVNPIEQGLDRSKLDPLLREVAREGVWVSAHPDVIMRMATKRVLYDTRELCWGTDTLLYETPSELREGLPARLTDGPRVLKRLRGMGGQGVWKVELEKGGEDPLLIVREALRDALPKRVHLGEFIETCAAYFADGGSVVEQPYQERIAEGMIRVYLSQAQVVGFAHQHPAGLRPVDAGPPPPGKRFELPDAEQFQYLRHRVELEWLPQMKHLLALDDEALPVIWDADFLYGPRSESGDDTYVLCEINASSTFAFPEHAMPTVAEAALRRIARRS